MFLRGLRRRAAAWSVASVVTANNLVAVLRFYAVRIGCDCEQTGRGSRRLTAANLLEGGGRAAHGSLLWELCSYAALPPSCAMSST